MAGASLASGFPTPGPDPVAKRSQLRDETTRSRSRTKAARDTFVLGSGPGCGNVGSKHRRSAFEQQHVPPLAAEAAEALAHPHDAEAERRVERHARLVLGEDAARQRPDAAAVGRLDQRGEERTAHASAPGGL